MPGVGATLAGFTPLLATAMLAHDGAPWWIAAYLIGLGLPRTGEPIGSAPVRP